MRWPFSKPKRVTTASLLQQADEQMQRGIPRQAICNAWLHMDRTALSLDEMQAYSEAERVLSGVMLERNLQGSVLEQAGQIDEAIKLYEANHTDAFIGSHPYERLRIIYTKRKQLDQAIRVCQTFIALERGAPEKKARFGEQVQKLQQKSDA